MNPSARTRFLAIGLAQCPTRGVRQRDRASHCRGRFHQGASDPTSAGNHAGSPPQPGVGTPNSRERWHSQCRRDGTRVLIRRCIWRFFAAGTDIAERPAMLARNHLAQGWRWRALIGLAATTACGSTDQSEDGATAGAPGIGGSDGATEGTGGTVEERAGGPGAAGGTSVATGGSAGAPGDAVGRGGLGATAGGTGGSTAVRAPTARAMAAPSVAQSVALPACQQPTSASASTARGPISPASGPMTPNIECAATACSHEAFGSRPGPGSAERICTSPGQNVVTHSSGRAPRPFASRTDDGTDRDRPDRRAETRNPLDRDETGVRAATPRLVPEPQSHRVGGG